MTDCPVQVVSIYQDAIISLNIAINFSLTGLQTNTHFFGLTQAGTFGFIPNEYTGCLRIKKYKPLCNWDWIKNLVSRVPKADSKIVQLDLLEVAAVFFSFISSGFFFSGGAYPPSFVPENFQNFSTFLYRFLLLLNLSKDIQLPVKFSDLKNKLTKSVLMSSYSIFNARHEVSWNVNEMI